MEPGVIIIEPEGGDTVVSGVIITEPDPPGEEGGADVEASGVMITPPAELPGAGVIITEPDGDDVVPSGVIITEPPPGEEESVGVMMTESSSSSSVLVEVVGETIASSAEIFDVGTLAMISFSKSETSVPRGKDATKSSIILLKNAESVFGGKVFCDDVI